MSLLVLWLSTVYLSSLFLISGICGGQGAFCLSRGPMDLRSAWLIRGAPCNFGELKGTDGQGRHKLSHPESQGRPAAGQVLEFWPHSQWISGGHVISDHTKQRLWSHPATHKFLSRSPPNGNCHRTLSLHHHLPFSQKHHPHFLTEEQNRHSKQLLKHFPAMWSPNTGNSSWLRCQQRLFASQGARAPCVSLKLWSRNENKPAKQKPRHSKHESNESPLESRKVGLGTQLCHLFMVRV